MIKYLNGDLFKSNTEALVNTVNLVGVMGKGIALKFKELFPINFNLYKKACEFNEINIGKLFTTIENNKIIINFPTKLHWKNNSRYIYIESGLVNLRQIIIDHKIKSISIPPLGCGNGGLEWNSVKSIIENNLSDLDCDILIYEN